MTDPTQQALYKALGARIRELRGNRLTQEQLAKEVGLTRTSIVNIEAGQQKLLVHNLFRIAACLGCRTADIISPLEPQRSPVADVKFTDPVTPHVDDWIRRGVTKAIQHATSL